MTNKMAASSQSFIYMLAFIPILKLGLNDLIYMGLYGSQSNTGDLFKNS